MPLQPIEYSEDARKAWMRTLALADWKELQGLAGSYESESHELIRPPETGLVMLRGRIGGTGGAFNLGEASVTRCAVKTADAEGHAYVLGRNAAHAKLAALCDALLQNEQRRPELAAKVVAPLEAMFLRRRLRAAQDAAATKVDFFTVARGDD
ncbi:MAG: phosphonate C-P lyase system protein PhnG [Aestuariivirga sp.]